MTHPVLLKTLRYVPLPSTMEDALSGFDALTLEKDTSFHSTVLLPVSSQLYNVLSPWILHNAYLDRKEFELVVDCPTYQFATEVGIAPDFDDELTIKALSKVTRFVKKLSILRSVDHPEIQRLLCNTPSLERLTVEVTDPSQAKGAHQALMKMLKTHPTIRGRSCAALSLSLLAFQKNSLDVLEDVIKSEVIVIIRDMIVQHGTRDLEALQTLLSSFSTFVLIDKNVRGEERRAQQQRSGGLSRNVATLPPPKGLEFYDEIFSMFESFFKSSDARFIIRHPNLFQDIVNLIEAFSSAGTVEEQREFWQAYRDDLILPLKKIVEEDFLVTVQHLNSIEEDEMKRQDPTFYFAACGDDDSMGNADSSSTMMMQTSSTESFLAFKNRVLSERDVRHNLMIAKYWITIIESSWTDEAWLDAQKVSRWFVPETAEERAARKSSEKNYLAKTRQDDDDDEDDDENTTNAIGSQFTVSAFRQGIRRMIESGRKSLSHIPFDKICDVNDAVNDPRMAELLQAKEIMYFKKRSTRNFCLNLFAKFVQQRVNDSAMLGMRHSFPKMSVMSVLNMMENEKSKRGSGLAKSILDFEAEKWVPLIIQHERFMRMFLNSLFKRRTAENDRVRKKYEENEDASQMPASGFRFTTQEIRADEVATGVEEYYMDSNDQAYSIINYLFSGFIDSPLFFYQFLHALLKAGFANYIVQDLDAIEEDSILRGKPNRWTIDSLALTITRMLELTEAIIDAQEFFVDRKLEILKRDREDDQKNSRGNNNNEDAALRAADDDNNSVEIPLPETAADLGIDLSRKHIFDIDNNDNCNSEVLASHQKWHERLIVKKMIKTTEQSLLGIDSSDSFEDYDENSSDGDEDTSQEGSNEEATDDDQS